MICQLGRPRQWLSEGREGRAGLSDTSAGLEASRSSFASGVALWAASLVMTSLTSVFPKWCRVTGLVAAALFTVTAVKIALGDTILATSAPLPSAGYSFLVLTFVGWIRTLLAPGRSPAASEASAKEAADSCPVACITLA